MSASHHLARLAALALLLGGCGHFHTDDHAFGAPPGGVAADATAGMDDAADGPSRGARLARLLHLPKDRPFGPEAASYGPYGAVTPGRKGAPPCRYGGTRCPPWERAWPARSGIAAADVVTPDGRVIPARKPPPPPSASATGAP